MSKSKVIAMAIIAVAITKFGSISGRAAQPPPYPTGLDLTTAGSSGTINGADFVQVSVQPTGTGYIDSFLRIQQNGAEAGYNTTVQSANNSPLQNIKQYTHDLLLSSLQVINRNGKDYYGFLLDINQQGQDPLLSLNQLQIFRTDTPGQTVSPNSQQLATANYKISPSIVGNLVYDMNPGTPNTYQSVQLNYDVGGNNSGGGSGNGDMVLYVLKSAFDAVTGDYVVLYSQFGAPPGTADSNDGFEEWAAFTAAAVPEPSTYIAGALLLLPVLAQLRRWKRAA